MTSRTEKAFESDSLQTLVHGIFAITMTLLILDLRLPEDLPEGHLSEALRTLAPQACAYALGFIYLMSNWLSYREMFRTARLGLDQVSTVLHLLAIGLISLTPFTVSLLARQAQTRPTSQRPCA